MARFITILLIAAVLYIVGTSQQTYAFFVKNSHAEAVPAPNPTNIPSPTPEARTEPLTASNEKPAEKLVQPSIPISPQISTPQKTNEQIVWERLIAEGFSREQTAGIMGNLQQEHNFKTNDSPGGLGIAQWMGGRRAALLAKANPYDINTQFDFMMEELAGSYAYVKKAILASGLDGALLAFQNEYERCGKCMESKRFMYAHQILGKY